MAKPAAGEDPAKLKRPAYAGHWAKSSVAAILKDRRAVGEHQPRNRDGTSTRWPRSGSGRTG